MRVRTYRRYKNPDGSVTVVSNGMIAESARAAGKLFGPMILAWIGIGVGLGAVLYPWSEHHWPLWLKILLTIPLALIGVTFAIAVLVWFINYDRRMRGLPPKRSGATKSQANNTARTRQQTAQLRAASWQKGVPAFQQQKAREEQLKEQMRRNRENPRPREFYFAKLAAEKQLKNQQKDTHQYST
jgi:hypothetical protein